MRPLAAVVEELRERIEALASGAGGLAAPTAGGGLLLAARRLAGRLWGAAPGVLAGPPQLLEIAALQADLDAVGVHTSLDAWLLWELRGGGARAARLCAGLEERARAAAVELEAAVNRAERAVRLGLPLARGTREALQRGLAGVDRAAKTAAILAAGAAPRAEPLELLVPGRPPAWGLRCSRDAAGPPAPVPDSRAAAAEWLWERGRRETLDLDARLADLEWALALLRRADERAPAAAPREDRALRRRLRGELEHALQREAWARELLVRPGALADVGGQLRAATRAGASSTWGALRSLYERGVEAGDPVLAGAAAAALAALAGSPAALVLGARRLDALRSLGLDEGAVSSQPRAPASAEALAQPAAETGTGDSTRTLERPRAPGEPGLDAALAQLALGLTDDAVRLLREASAVRWAAGLARGAGLGAAGSRPAALGGGVAGRWGASLAGPTLRFERTGDPSRLGDAVAPVAGRLLGELAAGELLVRRFDADAAAGASAVPVPEQRVLLLDASGSMLGVRARLRDALLVSELCALRVREAEGQAWAPVRYAYFADLLGELVTVGSAAEAAARALDVLSSSPAAGRGDLEGALEQLLAALAGEAPQGALHLVLVTDGEDPVDAARVARLVHEFRAPSVSFTVISLGEPNAGLEAVVAAARRTGRRAVYELLDDAEVAFLPSDFDARVRTLLPERFDPGPEGLSRVAPHLEALEAVAARRPQIRARGAAVPPERFDAFFPRADSDAPPVVSAPAPLVEAVVDVLRAVAEAVALAPAGMRAEEGIDLLVHLLSLRDVSIARYLEVARGEHRDVREAMATVRVFCRPVAADREASELAEAPAA